MTIQVGIDLGKSVAPPLAQSRIGSEVRPGYSGLYSVGSLKPTRTETAQPLWAMTLLKRSVLNFLEKHW